MKLEKIKLLLEYGNLEFTNKCVDCGKNVTVFVSLEPTQENGGEHVIKVEGGAVFEPPASYNYDTPLVVKCQSCFDIDNQVHQKNEIYSRVVGYMRPTVGWNPGKKAEFEKRAMFDMATMPVSPDSCGCGISSSPEYP